MRSGLRGVEHRTGVAHTWRVGHVCVALTAYIANGAMYAPPRGWPPRVATDGGTFIPTGAVKTSPAKKN
jgi:hypothetical protein